ncbi:corticotropin-releasing factor receptor 1 [Caerostris extrusa]|uniref:Corticotropin-releasing factor receptor 1 n=1 Tax=Caerostris extrusa TaxID=172846 RepID=A0AAV4YBP8_CAEEX|nr:corticotropin-releasing factor receptor 1 [Caerostris extrusa]
MSSCRFRRHFRQVSEVQTVLRKAYVRAALRRNPNHRYTWKCRTTRASQTSTYVSNCDNSVTDTALVRTGASPRSVHLLREVRTYDKGASGNTVGEEGQYTGQRKISVISGIHTND